MRLPTNKTASVQRLSRTPVSGTIANTWSTVYTGVPCTLEVLKSLFQASIAGTIENAEYRLSWQGYDIRNGDRVTVEDRTYVVKSISHDTCSPRMTYYTAILTEVR